MRLAMRARFRIFAVALCAAGLYAAGFLSPEPAHAREITYLQMANMTATAKTPDGRRTSVPVTTFLQVNGSQAAITVCRLVPVVRSAVVDATSQQPIPYAAGHLESDSIAAFVADRINAAIGAKTVARIAFIHGAPTAAAGQLGQMAPCRRIVAPPLSLNWVNAEAKKPTQTLAPPVPPLRENRAPAPSAPEFKTHPQFAPPQK